MDRVKKQEALHRVMEGGGEHPTYNKKKELQVDWLQLAFKNTLLKKR
jgi:hypothetical protein